MFDKKMNKLGIPFRLNSLKYPIEPNIEARIAREKNFFNYVRMQ